MQFSEDPNTGQLAIQRVEPGRLTINDKVYQETVLLALDKVVTEDIPASFAQLDTATVDQLCNMAADVILVGTGARWQVPQPEWNHHARRKGYQIEFMDTAAACRTYTVLTSEGRTVVALLFLEA
jgi:uncharacterized protein